MRKSDSTANIGDALAKVNLLMANPAKTSDVHAGAKRYKFAPLPEVLDVVRPTLQAHGISVLQEAATTATGYTGVSTMLLHSSGEWILFDPLVVPSANDAQGVGSAITYGRRYALCAALSIAADDDDDAEAAIKTSDGVRKGKRYGEGRTPAAPSENPSGVEHTAATTKPSDAPAPAPEPVSDHDHVWIDSPKLKKFQVCAVDSCTATQRKAEA